MNQFFHLNRFSLLVFKHWADNKKRYLLSVIAFIGLLITWFVFTMLTEAGVPMGKQMQQLTFIFSLFATGTFYASQYFRDLGSRPKGINFLLVPASAFEKILCSLLFTVIFFFIVFLASFYLADILMVTIADSFSATDTTGQRGLVNLFEITNLPFERNQKISILMIFLTIQAAFLLGSIYFEKYSFIKTIISGFVIFFIVFCLVYFLYEYVMPNGEYESDFLTAYRVDVDGKNDHLVRIPRWIGLAFYYLLMYATAPFLWIVTYYRLKEKQV